VSALVASVGVGPAYPELSFTGVVGCEKPPRSKFAPPLANAEAVIIAARPTMMIAVLVWRISDIMNPAFIPSACTWISIEACVGPKSTNNA
jgi:hypothetical protein